MDKKIKELINELNLSGKKIWYIPVRSNESIENYRNTILNRRTFNGEILSVSYWAFRLGTKNEKNFESMSLGDYVLFITRDSEGYEVIDSICVLSAKYVDSKVGEMKWNDSDYKMIVEFDEVFVLKNKLRLTFKREKLDNILPDVPNEIFHNGYEMFRQFILNERLTRTKLGSKLIEEEELIQTIKDYCRGSYLGTDDNNSSLIKDEDISSPIIKNDLNDSVENLFNKLTGEKAIVPAEVSIVTRKQQANDNYKSLSKKINRNESTAEPLSKKNQKLLGFMGEEYIYELLFERTEKLLFELGISNVDDVIDVEWVNSDYKNSFDEYIDKSLGHDIRVITKDKTVRLEVKTSFTNAGYYSITRNELKEMAIHTKNYYVVKVNHLCNLARGKAPTVILENFPIANVIENLNRVKSMEVYI